MEGNPMATTEAERVVDRMLRAYERGDVDEMMECFTEDAVYHAMPIEPAEGKSAIRRLVSEWFHRDEMKVLGIELHRQLSDATTVVHERTDRCRVGDRVTVTPLCSIFDIDNGIISGWREYFDLPR